MRFSIPPLSPLQVVYGITHPLNTWDPVFAQFHHVIDVFRKAWSMPGLVNKVCGVD